MSPAEFLLATVVVVVGTSLQGAVGFGLGLVGSPFLLLIDARLVPGPLLFASLVLTLLLTHRERREIVFSDLKWCLSGRVVGVACGAGALAVVSARSMAVAFGILVIVSVWISASGLKVALGRKTLLAAGVVSGFTATTVSIGGPPIALLYQHQPGPRVRGTLSAYFVVGAALSLVALHLVGRFGNAEMVRALSLLPGVLIGLRLSRRVARYLDGGHTRKVVLAVSAVAGIVVILKQVLR
ncbi:MAG: sulfite exporter TauE/SafE family protein [Gemmatimonadales bacterium]